MRQLCFWLSLLAGVGLTLVAVPSPAADKKTDEAAIKKLIDQLGSDDFAEREQAQKDLAKVGLPAYEALKKVVADAKCDPEVQQRASGILARLERELITAKVLTASKLSLDYKDTPVKEAVADFAKKSGYTIELFDPKNNLKDKKVTLKTGEVSFWEAFDQFCDASGLTEATLAEVAQELQKPGAPGVAPPPGGGQGGVQIQPGVIQVKPIRGVQVKPIQAKPVEAKPVEKIEEKPDGKKQIEKDPKPSDEAPSDTTSCDDKGDEDAKKKKAEEDAKKQAEDAAKKKMKAQVVAQQVQVQIQIAQPAQGGIIIGPGGPIMPGAPGMGFPFDTATNIILKEGKPKKEPTCYSGSMRIKAINNPAAVLGPVDAKQYLVGFQVNAEPKYRIVGLTGVKVLKALDDQDQTLRAVAEQSGDEINGGFGGAMIIRKRGLAPLPGIGLVGDSGPQLASVKLVKGVKEAKTFKELTGTITAQVLMAPEEMMEATDIRKASGKTFQGKDGGFIKILGVTENNGQLSLRVEYEAPKDVFPINGGNGQFNQWGGQMGGPGGGGFALPVQGGPVPPPAQDTPKDNKAQAKKLTVADLAIYGLTLVDDKGNPIQHRGVSVNGRWRNDGQVSNEYTITWAVAKDVAPSKLVFTGQRNATVDIPFTFKDVPVK